MWYVSVLVCRDWTTRQKTMLMGKVCSRAVHDVVCGSRLEYRSSTDGCCLAEWTSGMPDQLTADMFARGRRPRRCYFWKTGSSKNIAHNPPCIQLLYVRWCNIETESNAPATHSRSIDMVDRQVTSRTEADGVYGQLVRLEQAIRQGGPGNGKRCWRKLTTAESWRQLRDLVYIIQNVVGVQSIGMQSVSCQNRLNSWRRVYRCIQHVAYLVGLDESLSRLMPTVSRWLAKKMRLETIVYSFEIASSNGYHFHGLVSRFTSCGASRKSGSEMMPRAGLPRWARGRRSSHTRECNR